MGVPFLTCRAFPGCAHLHVSCLASSTLRAGTSGPGEGGVDEHGDAGADYADHNLDRAGRRVRVRHAGVEVVRVR